MKRSIWPPADQWFTVWGMVAIAVLSIIGSQLLLFFARLTGMSWIWLYAVGLVAALAGSGLILTAKLPLYRQGRVFTFGPKPLSAGARKLYWAGYALVGGGLALLLGLLLADP